MTNTRPNSPEKIREDFYENGQILDSAIDRISEIRSEVIERLGFAPVFVIQQKTERFMPRIDLFDAGDAYHVDIELPGMTTDEVSLTARQDRIRISGDRGRPGEDRKTLFLEQLEGYFCRTLCFDTAVDGKRCDAVLNGGILHLKLAKQSAESETQQEFEITVREG